MLVILKQDDIDRVDGEKRIGVAIFEFNEGNGFDLDNDEALDELISNSECIERVYGSNEFSAWDNARSVCLENNYKIVCEI